MQILDFLKQTEPDLEKNDGFHVRDAVRCADGFTISVQGGTWHHYCTPRSEHGQFTSAYDEVECGFPSEAEELLFNYAEDPSDLTGTVYAYVPIELVEEVIQKHGGIVVIED